MNPYATQEYTLYMDFDPATPPAEKVYVASTAPGARPKGTLRCRITFNILAGDMQGNPPVVAARNVSAEVAEGDGGAPKRKRGRPPKAIRTAPVAKKVGASGALEIGGEPEAVVVTGSLKGFRDGPPRHLKYSKAEAVAMKAK